MKSGLTEIPKTGIQPVTEMDMDSHFEVGMEVLVKVNKKWKNATVLNIAASGITVSYKVGKKSKMETIDKKSASDRLDCFVEKKDREGSGRGRAAGQPISHEKVKTWFDKLVNHQDFIVCQDVQNRISFKMEENFAIKITRKKDETRLYTGKVGHLCNQTFYIHDINAGELWIKYDLADFFTWDFDVTNIKHEIKLSDNGRRSILFPVTHIWVDLDSFQMEICYKDTIICRKSIVLPWFLSEWVIDNSLKWALKNIL